jgi:hypothetical protein
MCSWQWLDVFLMFLLLHIVSQCLPSTMNKTCWFVECVQDYELAKALGFVYPQSWMVLDPKHRVYHLNLATMRSNYMYTHTYTYIYIYVIIIYIYCVYTHQLQTTAHSRYHPRISVDGFEGELRLNHHEIREIKPTWAGKCKRYWV